jgi:spore maturation protein CgeB
MLRQNLQALARRDPALVDRLCWPVEGDHVQGGDGGQLWYHLQQTRLPLAPTTEQVNAALGAAPGAGELFVFGIGDGALIQALLAARPNTRLTAWDRDPWLLRLALDRHDWMDALTSGRLTLLLGTDLVGAARAGRISGESATVFHPLLGRVYRNERLLLAGWINGPVAALCAGGLFTDDLADALRAAGFSVYTLDIHRLSTEELALNVRALQPAVMVAVNYTEGLAEFAAAQRVKLLVWEIDPSTSKLPPSRAATGDTFVFTYRQANVAEFKNAGFEHVEYLPLAADPDRRAPALLSPDERRHYHADVAFVGSSLVPEVEGFRQAFVAAFAAAAATTALAPAAAGESARVVMDDVLAEQRRDFSRYVVPAALARRAPALARLPADMFAQLARPLGEIAAAEKRMRYVVHLAAAGAGVDVWGDAGWRTAPPSPLRYRGLAGHAIELTKIYNAAAINLDVGRLYQNDIVTMRVFDVLACGGFILAERSDALADLFALGVEIECYETLDELVEKVRYYLAHPAEAHAIAARGQQAVGARHTVTLRLRAMMARSGLHGAEVRR